MVIWFQDIICLVYWILAAGKYRLKIRLGQDASNLCAFVLLNLDLAILHRATGATGALHRLWIRPFLSTIGGADSAGNTISGVKKLF